MSEEKKIKFLNSEQIKELKANDKEFREEMKKTEKRVIGNYLKLRNIANLIFVDKKLKQ